MRWIPIWGLVLWLVILGVAIAVTPPTSAQARLTWEMKDCFTLNDVTAFLNTLPSERAVEAKVLTASALRTFIAAPPYFVWYRK